MRITRTSDKTHEYIKRIAKSRKETMLKTIDFIIDVFQQIPINAITPPPGLVNPRVTYRIAFYEQNKHKLEEHQRKYFEMSKKNMRIFCEENRKELLIFKAVYTLARKNNGKERLKEYNKQYYLRRKG